MAVVLTPGIYRETLGKEHLLNLEGIEAMVSFRGKSNNRFTDRRERKNVRLICARVETGLWGECIACSTRMRTLVQILRPT